MRLNMLGRVACLTAFASVAVLVPQVPSLLMSVCGPDFPRALLGAAGLLHLTLSAALLIVVTAARLGLVRPGPRFAAFFAAGIASTTLVPASAADLTALPLPDRPDMPSATIHVTVRAGDTLWAIAAAHERPGANAATIEASVGAWHAANRSTIGGDPDVLSPGQKLQAPR